MKTKRHLSESLCNYGARKFTRFLFVHSHSLYHEINRIHQAINTHIQHTSILDKKIKKHFMMVILFSLQIVRCCMDINRVCAYCLALLTHLRIDPVRLVSTGSLHHTHTHLMQYVQLYMVHELHANRFQFTYIQHHPNHQLVRFGCINHMLSRFDLNSV